MKDVAIIDKYLKGVFVLVAIGLISLIIFQALLQIEDIRHFIVPVEKWEGERIPFA